MTHLLTLNAGSSSIKFAVFRHEHRTETLAIGQIEALGGASRFRVRDGMGTILVERAWPAGAGPADHGAALALVLDWLAEWHPGLRIEAVGHRVVHGGQHFVEPVRLDDRIVALLRDLVPLAPLHQPHNLAGIAAAKAAFRDVPQIACFDTAFHRRQPFVNDVFAIPRRFYDEGVRRYGFHGLSYEFISGELRNVAPLHAAGRVVIAHLGNGASMAAVRDGQSIASTMGFSALDGLPMGTRSGQIDPGVLLYLMQEKGMDATAISDLLYKESGLKGLSGLSNDMRELEASESREAKQAIDYFVFRIRREIGAMAAILEGLDGIVFTGGIGENAVRVRERVLEGMEWIGIELDPDRNRAGETVISSDRSRARVFVIRTNEEAMIAQHTLRVAGFA